MQEAARQGQDEQNLFHVTKCCPIQIALKCIFIQTDPLPESLMTSAVPARSPINSHSGATLLGGATWS